MLEKKRATLVIVILLLLPIIGYLLWVSPSLMGRHVDIELSPLKAESGEITTFSVKTSEDEGVVHLPNNTLSFINGKFSTEQNLSFEGHEFDFQAIIPPNATNVNITVDSGGYSKIFEVTARRSVETFVSGEEIYNRMDYVTDPSHGMMHRVTSHLQLEMGARYFRDEFQSFGLEAEVVRYWQPSGDSPLEKAIGIFIWNVVAYHWGENKKEWIVLGGHFDMAPRTVEGAYDNTAGTNCVVEIARGLSQIKTNKTIVFGLWAGEEEGLWGAQEFVDSIPDDVTVKTYLNFDMAGINYPAPYDLRAIIGPDEDPEIIEQEALINLTNRTAFEILDYPRITGVYVLEQSHRGSDHYRFEQIGVPIVFFYGASANEYEAYHTPDDTLEEMERVAGGKDNLIGGFDTVAWMGFYLTILLDNDDTVHQIG
ncbi:MAG: M28 family peptidase [Methanomassiliicoccales archaeon]|nr:MAG: M28 family peptidase [Methanomassiliicoccales archaeon]